MLWNPRESLLVGPPIVDSEVVSAAAAAVADTPLPSSRFPGPKGSLKVDKYSRTNIPSIWGVGDVTNRIALTPVAIMEGQALGRTLATGEMVEPKYDDVPSACFSWPFVATVVGVICRTEPQSSS